MLEIPKDLRCVPLGNVCCEDSAVLGLSEALVHDDVKSCEEVEERRHHRVSAREEDRPGHES